MKNMEEKLGARTIMKVIGVDVPHAHIHLIPYNENHKEGETLSLSSEELEEIRQRLSI
jgi:diadenosine tetraphosphate (Ap4A) HIT family hydrolase